MVAWVPLVCSTSVAVPVVGTVWSGRITLGFDCFFGFVTNTERDEHFDDKKKSPIARCTQPT